MSIKKTVLILLVCVFSRLANSQDTNEADLPPGWWQLPKTSTQFKFGGYVKFDLIHDFDPIGSPDFFDVSKIPTDGRKGASTHLNAKETRLNLDVHSKIKSTNVRTYIEGDFYGSGGAFRLRHAFVEIGKHWLAGQWWSNFMDESIIPPTLDFEKPGAYAFARHPMLRYKAALSDDSYITFALEEPSENAQNPTEPGAFYSPIPDVNARVRLTKDWGHIQLTAFVAQLTYQYNAGGKDDVTLYGVNLSGQLNLFKADRIIYQGLYGPGVGRYRGGLSAGLDASGNLEAITDEGFTVGYQHQWVEGITSFFVYNHGLNNNTEGQPESSLHKTNYLAANLIWQFLPKAMVGMEYLHGTRTDKDESEGKANRLQFSVKYVIN